MWAWFLQYLFCFMKWGHAYLSVLWHTVIPALAECLGSLPGSKAVPQTTYATSLQSMIQNNLPVPLWTLYQRSWLDPRRRSDAFPSLIQSSSLTSLKEITVRGRKAIQQQRLNTVIPNKESRGWSVYCVCESSGFCFKVPHKALFLRFYIGGQNKRSWMPPKTT